jgi:hypothetical protein
MFLISYNFYQDFRYYAGVIENLLLNIIGGAVGLLGFILTGVALIVGLFNKRIKDKIEYVSKKEGAVTKILTSFEFAALSIGLEIVILMFLYLIINMGLLFYSQKMFYIIFFLVCYFIMFNLFYTIGLVYNSVSLYEIFIIYSDIIEKEEAVENE